MESSLLAGWDNFYVITGGAAGGLTGLTFVSLSLGIGVVGLAGLVYIATIAAAIHRMKGEYTAVPEDWIWNVVLPALCFGVLLLMALLLSTRSAPCLYGVAAAIMLLMIIGIHNAWDIAVWNSINKQKETEPKR